MFHLQFSKTQELWLPTLLGNLRHVQGQGKPCRTKNLKKNCSQHGVGCDYLELNTWNGGLQG